jgi:hypothetical protein
MSAHKRSKLERENDLLTIAEMHANHVPQRKIADLFGITQGQISRDVKEIYKRWAEPDKTSLATCRARMLAKIRSHEKLSRELLNDSRKPRERNEASLRSEPGGIGGDGEAAQATPDKEVVSKKQTTEGQCGNPSYLKSIEWCMEQEIKLRGLTAPQKLEFETTQPIQFINVHEVHRNDMPADSTPAAAAGQPEKPGGGAGDPAVPRAPAGPGQGAQITLAGP